MLISIQIQKNTVIDIIKNNKIKPTTSSELNDTSFGKITPELLTK